MGCTINPACASERDSLGSEGGGRRGRDIEERKRKEGDREGGRKELRRRKGRSRRGREGQVSVSIQRVEKRAQDQKK